MHKQCYTLPERPGMLVPDLPAELDELICTLLDKNPARRPASAAGVIEELERLRGKLERHGEKLAWPAKITPDTAEVAALPAARGAHGDGEAHEPEPRPLLKRPWVVIPLFLLSVAALVVPLVWPQKSAEELFAAAQPLLQSDNPDDWQAALEKYLEPLAQKYPEEYTREIAAVREKLQDRRELQQALADGAAADPRSEAERGYRLGLRFAQAGEFDAARRTWQAVVQAFAAVSAEHRWVELSRIGIVMLDRSARRPPRAASDRPSIEQALQHAQKLAAAGQYAEADAIVEALQRLTEYEPDLRKFVEETRPK